MPTSLLPAVEATPDRTRQTHFPLFDGLRGLAATAVFFVHAAYQFAVTRPGEHEWYRFAIHGDVAVPIFFAVSGFLLYRPFVAARATGRPIDVRAYARRRFLRIVPAYWVALALISLYLQFDEIRGVPEYLWYMLFLQLYDPDTALKAVGQAWTLDIEVTFYVFLPLWVWLTTRPKISLRNEALAVVGLIGFAFSWQVVTLLLTDVANYTSNSATLIRILPIQFDHLGAGMLLAVLSVWAQQGKRLPGVRLVVERPWIVWGLALLIWLAACYVGRDGGRSSYQYTDRQFFAEHVLYTPFVFLLLLPAVFGDERRDPIRRFLAWRPIAFVGLISYSFYLYHFAVIVFQYRRWDSVPDGGLEWFLWLAPAYLATVAVGAVGFYLIEKPFMSLRNRRRSLGPPHGEQAKVVGQ
jgi:peptidoglycan/LPS O-acetylase OafA/YrhL